MPLAAYLRLFQMKSLYRKKHRSFKYIYSIVLLQIRQLFPFKII